MARKLLSTAMLFALVAVAPGAAVQTVGPEADIGWIKVYVHQSGAYRIPLGELRQLLSATQTLEPRQLEISHRGLRLPQWLDLGEEGSEGHLIFAVPSAVFRDRDRHDASRLAALRIDLSAQSRLPLWSATVEEAVSREGVSQVVRLEEDRVLAPLTAEPDWDSPSLWHWSLLSQRSSSDLRLQTSIPTDVLTTASLNLGVGLLGWSRPQNDLEASDHAVSVSLDGVAVGTGTWDGRRPFELRLEGVGNSEANTADSVELRVKVPRRVDGSGREIVDLSYVDWVELDYPLPAGPAASQLTLRISATSEQARRWSRSSPPRLTDSGPTTRIYSSTTEPEGGALEAFAASPEQLLRPMRLAAVRPASLDRSQNPGAQYVLVAPPHFLDGARRLAALHQARGIETLVVDAHQIFNEMGDGLRQPQALRDYLLDRHARHGALRWVLLVGDADWYAPDEPPLEDVEGHRNLLPSWTFLSRYGPAVSDHYYAVADDSQTTPRFAVGRLPVATLSELTGVIDKIERYLSSSQPERSALLLGSLDAPSQGRLHRLRRRWQPEAEGKGYEVRELDRTSAPDEALLAAWNQDPTVVLFSGHGSRHLWRLGDVDDQRPETLWSQEESAAAAATDRPPAVISLSCATAPFDHPNNDSLGEALVLDPDGGAVGFFGASATLYTMPRFGEQLLSELTSGKTLGESLVEAKRHASNVTLSHLYNLLGDPALALH